MEKIKILHIFHSLEVGGLENGVVNLVNRLDRDRYEHEICCIASSGPMAERIQPPVPIHVLGKDQGGRAYLLPFKLAGLIRRVAPDIVHTRNWGAIDGVVAARLAGVRKVVHGEHGREATDPTGANRRRRQIRRLLSPMIHHFIAVSADLARWLVEDVGVPGGKVTHIINGVDAVKFRPLGERSASREELGLPVDKCLIGIVGRLDPVKDHATLLKAFSRLDQTAHLVVVGDGPVRAELVGLADGLGVKDRVLFLGNRNDVPAILPALDVFVLPSIAEGISNTILEAMACGLPVVASRVGGNPELVDDAATGFLFPAGDEKELAGRLKLYLENSDLRQEHGRAARERIEREFSLEAMVDRYDRLYRSIL